MDGTSRTNLLRTFLTDHPLEGIIILGLLIRLPVILLSQVHGDEGMYMYDAQLILKGSTPFSDFHTRAPVFIYSLAFMMMLFGESVLIARLFTLVVFVLTTLCIHRIGREIDSDHLGLISAAVFSFSPFSIVWGSVVETEVLLILIISIAGLMLIRGSKRAILKDDRMIALGYLFASGVILGISVFTRRTGIILFPAFLLHLYVFWYGQRKDQISGLRMIKRKLPFFIVFSAGFLMTMIIFFIAMIMLTDLEYLVDTFFSSAGVGSGNSNRIQVLKGLVEHAWYLLFPLHIVVSRSMKGYMGREMRAVLDLIFFLVLIVVISLYTHISYIILIPLFGIFLIFLWEQNDIELSFQKRLGEQNIGQNEQSILVLVFLTLIVILTSSISESTLLSYVMVLILLIVLALIFLIGRSLVENSTRLPGSFCGLIFLLIFASIYVSDAVFGQNVFSLIGLFSIYLFSQKGVATAGSRNNDEMGQGQFIFPLIWFTFVSIFYMTYNMLGEIYLYELMPAVSLLVGIYFVENNEKVSLGSMLDGLREMDTGRIGKDIIAYMIFLILILSTILSGANYYQQEIGYGEEGRTNGFDQIPGPSTIKDVGNYIESRIDKNEGILTANMAIAVEANRGIIMDLSHPSVYSTVYKAGFASLDTIGYPTLHEIMDHMNRTGTKIVVKDLFLNQYYLRSNPLFRDYIESHYHVEKRIDNVDILIRSNIEIVNRPSVMHGPAGNARQCISQDNSTEVTVWEQMLYGRSSVVYGITSVDPGEYSARLIPGGMDSNSFSPEAIIDGGNRMHVVWEERYTNFSHIMYATINEDVVSIESITSENGIGSWNREPRIYLDHSETIHVIWVHIKEGSSNLMYSRWDPSRHQNLVPTVLLSLPEGIRHPDLEGLTDGSVQIVIETGGLGMERIKHGVILGEEMNASLLLEKPFETISSEIRSVAPSISTVGPSQTHIVWKQYSKNNEQSIKYVRIDQNSLYSMDIAGNGLMVKTSGEGEDDDHREGMILGFPSIGSADDEVLITWTERSGTGRGSIHISRIVMEPGSPSNDSLSLEVLNNERSIESQSIPLYFISEPDILVRTGVVHLAFTGTYGSSTDVFLSRFSA
jgi:4-amino-4-deoxy-L-arabinose transferase-like glycosyltransferase